MTSKADANYRAALDYLFARTNSGTKFGLETTRAMLALLGDPHRELAAFHVAGTNGKGSVVATLEAVLRSRGLKVGTYTSPHLVDFRERIRVNGEQIPAEAVTTFIERWTPDAERIGATFFEVTTALAFDWLSLQEVDVAVIETGLGGRLDSTNVIEPVSAGVTSVDIDHTEYLGDTLSAIAAEKAGIFKPGVPAIVGERDPLIRGELAQHARDRGAEPVHVVAEEYTVAEVSVGPDGTRMCLSAGAESALVHTPLIGAFQAWNVETAFAMLQSTKQFAGTLDQFASGLAGVKLPGRFDRRGRHIFDVAHNPAGAAGLARTLATVDLKRPVVALAAVLSDKDWKGVLRELAPAVDSFVLTVAPTAPHNRRWDPAAAGAYVSETLGIKARVVPDFDAALEAASHAGETIVITGSFHTVGDAMSRLHVSPMAG